MWDRIDEARSCFTVDLSEARKYIFVALMAAATTASAQQGGNNLPLTEQLPRTELRLDFGGRTNAADGFLPVGSNLTFDERQGFGWVEPRQLVLRDQGRPDARLRDFVQGTLPATFRISGLKPGIYLIELTSGDVLSSDAVTRVSVNGAVQPQLAAPAGSAAVLRLTVDVRDDLLILFETPARRWVVNSLEVSPATSPVPAELSRISLAGGDEESRSRTLVFSTNANGKKLELNTWGVDIALPDPNNIRRSALYMGEDQIDVVRVSFPINEPLVDGDLPSSKHEHFSSRVELLKLIGERPIRMLPDTDRGVHPWFKDGKDVNPERWLQLMAASQRRYGKKMVAVEPFNEADWGWGQGDAENLARIMDAMRASNEFAGVDLIGPSTLGTDAADRWYQVVKDRVRHGTTHALGGSFPNYINFFLNVDADGKVADNPEVHNLVEVISGAEYGLDYAIWWANADLARGEFVKAVQGERLAYAEDRSRWSAAGVYRAPSGKIQAFLGSSERLGSTTDYRFVCKDRPVFFDGEGPTHDIVIPIRQDTERRVNITWGADVQPKVGGRYVIANRDTGRVLAVRDAAKTQGAGITQQEYDGSASQQWEVLPVFSRYGDQSHFVIRAVHSGLVLEVPDWSHDEAARVRQYGDGAIMPQNWFFDYAGANNFHIRSRWSAKYLQPQGAEAGAEVVQTATHDSSRQQWRLIPAGIDAVEFVPPAPPEGVVAIPKPHAIEVRWQPVADAVSYTVLRASANSASFDTIARGLTATHYVDPLTAGPGQYRYVVVAEDRCLNRSANSQEVAAAPSGGHALVAHYAFQGSTDDSSGNGNHAVMIGDTNYTVGPSGASAIAFDGQDDMLRLPVGVSHLQEMTVAVWVYRQHGERWQRIFDFGNDETQFLFLTPESNQGMLRLAARNGGFEQHLEVRGLPENRWSHVAVSVGKDGARMYVNGKLVAEDAAWRIRPVDISGMFNYVGKSQFPVDPTYRGRLSDLRIYNHVLPGDEIAKLAWRESGDSHP